MRPRVDAAKGNVGIPTGMAPAFVGRSSLRSPIASVVNNRAAETPNRPVYDVYRCFFPLRITGNPLKTLNL